MFKIGDFSRLSQVTVKTLRYYDDIGLLKPVSVDRFTGYRYYSADQLPRLNRILALKEMDLSLDQIRRLLEDGLPASEMRGMLRLKQAELRQRVQEEQDRLIRLESRLSQIEKEGKMPGYDVVIKQVEPRTVAAIREVVPSYSDTGRLFGEIFAHLGRSGARPDGPPMAIYHDNEYKERDADVEALVAVAGPVAGSERVKVRDLPAMRVASTVHQGSYEGLSAAYAAVMSWIEANGYKVAGSNTEVYLKGPESPGGPDTYVTEIQFPVAR